MFYFCFITIFIQVCSSLDLSKLNYLDYCKDNDDIPVDWWYIYKPPQDFFSNTWQHRGLNFTYLTPDTPGRWQSAQRHARDSYMLEYTLMPLYKPSKKNRLAYAVYEESSASSAQGILMANEKGGVWITHTVPGFPDLTRHRPIFPEAEKANGHLMMCLTVDLTTINEIASVIKLASPKFTNVHIPSSMEDKLPDWIDLKAPVDSKKLNEPMTLDVDLSKKEPLKLLTIVKQPGDQYCLYRSFAMDRLIVLDVYGRTDNDYMTCGDKYSVRNIDSISLKYPEYIYYVPKSKDESQFAVSTAAHWQQRGSGPTQYWVCTTNLDNEGYNAKGGVLLCVENYHIWWAFRNLIVKEPEC